MDGALLFTHVQLGFQRVLEDLGEVDVSLQGGGVEPGGQCDSPVDRAVDLGHTDRGHIDINQAYPLIVLRVQLTERCGRGDGRSVLLQPAHDTAQQLTGGEKCIAVAGPAGSRVQIREDNRNLLTGRVGEDCGVDIAFRFFHQWFF